MTDKQPKALSIADWLDEVNAVSHPIHTKSAAAELRLQHSQIEYLSGLVAEKNKMIAELQQQVLQMTHREWQGLTDDEQMQVAWSCGAMSADWLDFARAIEAKLKEKNT